MLLVFLLLVTLALSLALYFQYSYFVEQAEKMLILQQDYQNYIALFKKSFSEPSQQGSEYFTIDEKKKPLGEPLSHALNENGEVEDAQTKDLFYPQKTLASNMEMNEEIQTWPGSPKPRLKSRVWGSFLVVNRGYQYLKESAVEFSKKHNLEYAVKHMYDLYDWNEDGQYSFIANEKNVKKIVVSKKNEKTDASRDFHFYKDSFTFQWPMDKSLFRIGSKYGPRKKTNGTWGFHQGIDLPAAKGTPVKAAATGVVIETSYSPNGYGKSVVIAHNKKYRTRYAHLDTIYVKIGQKVEVNEYIGRVGATGFVVGKKPFHLHFEVIVFGKKINPLYVLNHK